MYFQVAARQGQNPCLHALKLLRLRKFHTTHAKVISTNQITYKGFENIANMQLFRGQQNLPALKLLGLRKFHNTYATIRKTCIPFVKVRSTQQELTKIPLNDGKTIHRLDLELSEISAKMSAKDFKGQKNLLNLRNLKKSYKGLQEVSKVRTTRKSAKWTNFGNFEKVSSFSRLKLYASNIGTFGSFVSVVTTSEHRSGSFISPERYQRFGLHQFREQFNGNFGTIPRNFQNMGFWNIGTIIQDQRTKYNFSEKSQVK